MSLSGSLVKYDFEPYDGSNYLVWYEGVKDYFYENDFSVALTASEKEAGTSGSTISMSGNDEEKKEKRKKIKHAWGFIRRHLNNEWKQKVGAEGNGVTYGDPVKLLRFLRLRHYDNSPFDRSTLRNQFSNLTFDSCRDLDDYVDKFTEFRSLYAKHGINMHACR